MLETHEKKPSWLHTSENELSNTIEIFLKLPFFVNLFAKLLEREAFFVSTQDNNMLKLNEIYFMDGGVYLSIFKIFKIEKQVLDKSILYHYQGLDGTKNDFSATSKTGTQCKLAKAHKKELFNLIFEKDLFQ